MDTEEQEHLQELERQNRPLADEGPFYHHTFWESYKGGIKGKLGGIILGGGIGLLLGSVAYLAILGLVGVGVVGAAIAPEVIIGGIAVGGMLYGMHEFGDVGRITGAVAAGLKVEERRMHEFELGKFKELKSELDEIKNMVAGRGEQGVKNVAAVAQADEPLTEKGDCSSPLEEARARLADYRTSHYNDTPLKADGGLVFWKVALVGTVVGVGVGLALATGVGGGLLAHIGLSELVGQPVAASVVFGAVGASFGISRDLFRKVFDITDLLFKGFTADRNQQVGAKSSGIEMPITEVRKEPATPSVSTTVAYDNSINYPVSETHYRDKIDAARASQLLASLDHAQATRH